MNENNSVKPINTGRQIEVDIAKTIALICMLFCHVGITFLSSDDKYYIIPDMVGAEWSAPVFMTCLGIGICYSKRNSMKEMIKKGFVLIIAGYVLNFLREIICVLILNQIGKNNEQFATVLDAQLSVDILQFAGWAYIFIAIIKHFGISNRMSLLISIGLTLLGEATYKDALGNSTGNHVLDLVLGNFYGTNYYTFFPFLHWIIYPCFGLVMGEIIMYCKDKKELYKKLLPISLMVILIARYIYYFEGAFVYYNTGSYYFTSVKTAVIGCFFPLFLFSIGYFVKDKIPKAGIHFIEKASKYMTAIYCISWILINWIHTAMTIGAITCGYGMIILLFIVISVASYCLANVLKLRI